MSKKLDPSTLCICYPSDAIYKACYNPNGELCKHHHILKEEKIGKKTYYNTTCKQTFKLIKKQFEKETGKKENDSKMDDGSYDAFEYSEWKDAYIEWLQRKVADLKNNILSWQNHLD